MKKGLILLFFIVLLSWQNVSATPPIMPGEMTIEFVDCEREDLLVDLFVRPHSEGQLDEVIENRMPAHGIVTYDGYESAQAYNETFWYDVRGCTHELSVGVFDEDDLYVLIYDTSGGIHYLEKYRVEELGYDDDYSHYTTLRYDEDTQEMELDISRNRNPFLAMYVIIVFLFAIVPISYVVFAVIYHKSLFKNAYPEINGTPYIALALGADVFALGLVYIVSVTRVGITLGLLFIIVAQLIGAGGWILYSTTHNEDIDRNDIYRQLAVKLIIALLLGGLILQMIL